MSEDKDSEQNELFPRRSSVILEGENEGGGGGDEVDGGQPEGFAMDLFRMEGGGSPVVLPQQKKKLVSEVTAESLTSKFRLAREGSQPKG